MHNVSLLILKSEKSEKRNQERANEYVPVHSGMIHDLYRGQPCCPCRLHRDCFYPFQSVGTTWLNWDGRKEFAEEAMTLFVQHSTYWQATWVAAYGYLEFHCPATRVQEEVHPSIVSVASAVPAVTDPMAVAAQELVGAFAAMVNNVNLLSRVWEEPEW
jgi:hypothetical protein